MICRQLRGFALPTVIASSVIMLIVLLVSISATVALRGSLTSEYYNQLAKNASDAGLIYAKECIAKNGVTWSDDNPLGPNTDCSGKQLPGFTCPDGSTDERCWVMISGYSYAQVLVVAGGGGGGSSLSANGGAGGGGGGGLVYKPSYLLLSGQSYNIEVGDGGSPGTINLNQNGTQGENSSFGSIIAIGGGYGSKTQQNGGPGGSGGGAGYNTYSTVYIGGNGTSNQGNKGGDTSNLSFAGGAGGGGAGGIGADNGIDHSGGVGGLGLAYSISGASVTYAAGGSGGDFSLTGSVSPANSGKGGDGAYANRTPYAGGSGVVIVSYPTGSITATGGTITTSAGNTIHTFTSDGVFNVTNTKNSLNVSTFSVMAPDVDSSGNIKKIISNGTTKLLRKSDNSVWRQYNQTSQITVDNSSSSFLVKPVEVLVVAGGGGGGSRHGGGGGGGGLVHKTIEVSPASYNVVVGGGGAGGIATDGSLVGFAGSNGGNSIFGSITTLGGGGGGSNNGSTAGKNGGSGGGANASSLNEGMTTQPVSIDGGFGNNGTSGLHDTYYMGGGGGGAGGIGSLPVYPNAGSGGPGYSSSISGSLVTYAKGGNGGIYELNTVGVSGSANTGNGGSGSGGGTNNGGNGGSGVVIVSYPTGSITATGGTVSYSGNKTIHRFTSSGSFVVNSVGSWAYKRAINISNQNTSPINDYQVNISPFVDSSFINNQGLVGSWHFNEDTSEKAFDMSSMGNDGVINGSTALSTNGRFGNGFYGDGTSSNKVVIPNHDSINMTNSLSIEAWVNFSSSRIGGIVTRMNSTGTYASSYAMFQIGRKIRFYLYKDSSVYTWTTDTDLPLNTWHHVVSTWDGSTTKVYINGKLDMTPGTLASPIDPSYYSLSIGGYPNDVYLFDGKIDEVKLYNRALTGPATSCDDNSANEVCQRYGALGVPKIRSDYADIRFTDATGTANYSFWQEDDRTFWVKIPSLLPGDTTIYMYYGNPKAGNASNGDDTFQFFDNFLGNVVNPTKWVKIDSRSTINQSDGLVLSPTSYAWTSALISKQKFYRTDGLTVGGNIKIGSFIDTSWRAMFGWALDQDINPSYTQLVHGIYYNYGNMNWVYEGGTNYASVGTYSENSFNDFSVKLKATGADYNNNNIAVYTGTGGNFTTSPMRVAVMQNTLDGVLNNIYVRRGSVNEPTHTVPTEEIPLYNYLSF